MADSLVLAVDCSTTAVKAIVFDASGRSVGGARRPLSMLRPQSGFHEQDGTQWWDATIDAMAEAIASIDHPADIEAISISHQRESFVCLDADGRPIRPAILWVDTRAAEQIAEFGSPRVAQVSGKPPDVTPAIYKMAWLRQHEPATLREAIQVGDVQAFLAQRLTGRWATSHGSADALGLFDLANLTWDDDLLAVAGVRREQLPELVPSGDLLATLTAEAARDLGLPAPIPLVAGTGDGQAAGLGADAGGSSIAYLNLGTSMVMGVASDEYVTDAAFRTLAGPAAGTFVLETLLNSAGYLVEWFRTQFGLFPDNDELNAAVAAVPAGADGLLTLPYWNAVQPPHWDPLARGATVGWHGGHTPAHFVRSMLEGVAFEAELHLSGLERATGTPITSLHAVGGGTRSTAWVQIMADVTGRDVQVETEGEMSAKGVAVLARAYLAYGGNAGIARAVHDMAARPSRCQAGPEHVRDVWPARRRPPRVVRAVAADVPTLGAVGTRLVRGCCMPSLPHRSDVRAQPDRDVGACPEHDVAQVVIGCRVQHHAGAEDRDRQRGARVVPPVRDLLGVPDGPCQRPTGIAPDDIEAPHLAVAAIGDHEPEQLRGLRLVRVGDEPGDDGAADQRSCRRVSARQGRERSAVPRQLRRLATVGFDAERRPVSEGQHVVAGATVLESEQDADLLAASVTRALLGDAQRFARPGAKDQAQGVARRPLDPSVDHHSAAVRRCRSVSHRWLPSQVCRDRIEQLENQLRFTAQCDTNGALIGGCAHLSIVSHPARRTRW